MKINFIFSPQYQDVLGHEREYLASQVNDAVEHMRLFWDAQGEKIEQSFKKHIGLSFTQNEIPCYLNFEVSISDPLSLEITPDKERMENNLIHELCHVLFTYNFGTNDEFCNKWMEYYKASDEPRLTKSHIPVHALHFLVSKDIFPERDVTYDSVKPEYKASWDFVLKQSPEKVLESLKISL